nr:muscle M-line assembly protein unc-89 isoform X1 [Arachis hypogaea]XP_025636496.1 muscle M-line assembly protein unc-89 isoform X1 [Arachis hypogaea]XP_025636504.1 muscle M-line assembly protein unc-89 isoform X1 [Arachis hypogaea]
MRAEMDEHMGIVKMAETKEKLKQMKKNEKTKKTKKERQVHHLRVKQVKEKSILPLSLRLKKTQRIQQGNNPPEQPKSKTESKKKKKIQEDSDSESKSNDESEKSSIVEKQKTKKKTKRTPQKTQSKKKKVIVEDSSPEQAQSYHEYEIGTEELEEILRESRKKKNNEKSATQGEKEADLRSTEGHYVSSETIPEVNLGTVDPLSQGHTDQSSVNKPAESMLGLVEESANEPAKENMMVVRIETQSQTEALQIVPIQVCLPLSQTTTVPEIEPTPVPEIKPTPAKSPSEKTNEETTKMCILSLLGCISSQLFCNTAALQNHRQTLNKAHPRFHQLHLKSPEDAAALIMMARTASYIPKQDPMPSFSLGLTDSSQEEASTQEGAATQEGQRAKTPETPKLIEQLRELVEKITGSGVKTEGKTPPIHKQSGEESFQKFETPARTNVMSAEMKEKCYIWATRVKTYADGKTNEYDTVCTLNAQDKYIISKIHFASLQADTHIEAEIVSAMCLILNQQNIKRFQEEIYFL